MARLRSGQDLVDDAYRRSDTQGELDRHPRPDVLRYVNQGGAALWDLLIKAQGRSYFRSPTPWTITTTANTTLYTTGYPPRFYQLLGVRLATPYPVPLDPLPPLQEAYYDDSLLSGTVPEYYDLRPNGIALFPRHERNLTVVVDYIPSFLDLEDSPSSFLDGVNGWEEYPAIFAAHCIAVKDDEDGLASRLEKAMSKLEARIALLAPHRDRARARGVRDVRGPKVYGCRSRRW